MESAGPFEAIVLAGGAGARFGGGKLTAPRGDGVLLDAALAAARRAPVRHVVLVAGFDGETVAAAARRLVARDPDGAPVEIVHASDHAEGMAATLRAGVRALAPDTAGVFLFLGDMPEIPADTGHQLAAAIGDRDAAAPIWKGQRGHPVLFARRTFADLTALRGDSGARALLESLGPRLVLVEASGPGVLFDVDRPSDLARPPSSCP